MKPEKYSQAYPAERSRGRTRGKDEGQKNVSGKGHSLCKGPGIRELIKESIIA